MQESSRYAIGLDIGTSSVRAIISYIDIASGIPTIVGIGQTKSSGMRKGTVVDLNGLSHSIGDALDAAEKMSGHQVEIASISINGQHILNTKVNGMIAVGGADHEISPDDVARLENVAMTGKVPANRVVLCVVPHQYKLDGQDGIKEPIGMTGTRLEIDANVISSLEPDLTNLRKSAETANLEARNFTVSVMAAARAVLKEEQAENGVAVIDMGGSTTGVAVYEEGDLQYVGVIPIGGMNITNDLAIGLKTEPEVAEQVKVMYADAVPSDDVKSTVVIKNNGNTYEFKRDDISEIVNARLEEIFEAVQHELKNAGRAKKLPNGVVLTGGTANLKHVDEYAKQYLGVAAKVGHSSGFGGVTEHINEPQFATAVGLMLIDNDTINSGKSMKFGQKVSNYHGFFAKLLKRLKL